MSSCDDINCRQRRKSLIVTVAQTRPDAVAADDETALTFREKALTPTLVMIGLCVALISSLGAPLIPTIANDNHVTLAAAQWSLTITLLVGAIATPLIGRLGDGSHRRRVLIFVVSGVFTGSLIAALPLGFTALLAGRALQGLGLALIPLVMSVARDHLPNGGRSTISLLSVTAITGVGLGYPITGFLAEHGGVHGAFWFGTTLSAIAVLLAVLFVPKAPTRVKRPLDLVGGALLAAGLAMLLLALANGGSWGWTSGTVLSLAVGAVALLCAWGWWTLHTAHPLIDLRLFRYRGVQIANLSGALSGMGMYITISMTIRLAQTPTSTGYGIGASVALASVILLPMSAGSILSSRLFALFVRRRLPADLLIPVGTLILLLAMVVFALSRSTLWQLAIILGIVGLGIGITVSVMPSLIMRSVPSTETGSAMGFNQVLRTASYSVGSAISGSILEAHTKAGQSLPTSSGYQVGAYFGIALCVLTLVLLVPLMRGDSLFAAPVSTPATSDDEQVLREESLADALSEDDAPSAEARG
jgi:MFS family permease